MYIAIPKWRTGSRVKKYWIKARPKPIMVNVKSCSSMSDVETLISKG